MEMRTQHNRKPKLILSRFVKDVNTAAELKRLDEENKSLVNRLSSANVFIKNVQIAAYQTGEVTIFKKDNNDVMLISRMAHDLGNAGKPIEF